MRFLGFLGFLAGILGQMQFALQVRFQEG